jgi:hypothetical protein
MKTNSLFSLAISLATVVSLLNIQPAFALKFRQVCRTCECRDDCPPIIRSSGNTGRTTIPIPYELSEKLRELNIQGNIPEIQRLIREFSLGHGLSVDSLIEYDPINNSVIGVSVNDRYVIDGSAIDNSVIDNNAIDNNAIDRSLNTDGFSTR